MRVVVGIALVFEGVTVLRSGIESGAAALQVIVAGAGVLLIVGLWTPIAGTVVTLIQLWNLFMPAGDLWNPILLATLGAALALLGPAGCSVDAPLFGWKRIASPGRNSKVATFFRTSTPIHENTISAALFKWTRQLV